MNMQMLSMCLSIIKIKGNKMHISAAGMPPALIYRSKTKTVEEIVLKGPNSIDSIPVLRLTQKELWIGDDKYRFEFVKK